MAVESEHVADTLPADDHGRVNPTPAARYDLLVVGDTPEAILAARLGARRHRKVALVATDAPLYRSAAPVEAAARQLREAARSAPPARRRSRGSQAVGASAGVGFAEIIERARQALDAPGTSSTRPMLAGGSVDLFRGRGRFVSSTELHVDGVRLSFRRAILATGRGQSEEELAAARSEGCLEETDLLRLNDLPERLAIVGTNVSQCQWAQTFSRLGSQVYLLGREPAVLPELPEAISRRIRDGLAADGVSLHLGCEEILWERTGSSHGVLIRREGELQKLFVDQVLVHVPRRPRVGGLDLEQAGVASSEAGVEIDPRLRTTNRRIFAVGELCAADFGSREATRTMTRRAVANALGFPIRRFSGQLVPHCVHTRPEAIRFGWTADEAARRCLRVRTFRLELPEADFGTPDAPAGGFVEAVVRHRSGRLLGATIVAAAAAELAAPLIVLATRGLPLAALADVQPCQAGPLASLGRLAQNCRRVLPWHPWSAAQEEMELVWERFLKWKGGNDECRKSNDEGMTKPE